VSGYALVVVDMIKGNVKTDGTSMMDVEATKIIPKIQQLIRAFRSTDNRIVFACDSFMEGDFIFRGRMPPHAIRGTGQDEPIPELGMQPTDHFLPKRRMSAFYKTDLDQTLRTWGVDRVVVCGIVTNVCVLLTALDSLQNDFHTVIATDACACHRREIHEMTLKTYESFLLQDLFRMMTVEEIAEELLAKGLGGEISSAKQI
jgi:nicotinamidase/pyrazinamidase